MQMHGDAVAELQSQGLLRLEDGRCAPTLRGMLYIKHDYCRLNLTGIAAAFCHPGNQEGPKLSDFI